MSTATNTSSIDANKNDLSLNGIKEKSKKSLSNSNGLSNCTHPPVRRSSSESPSKPKRQRIFEKISYEDLGAPIVEPNLNEADISSQKKSQHLNLAKIERYLHGPVPVLNNESTNEPQELEITQYQILHDKELWGQRTPHKVLVSATAAVNALGELSPGGALMRGFQEQSLAQLVPSDVEKELRNLYLSLSELLRHFWRAFPPTTPELESKAVRMHEALQRFKMAKLTHFEDRSMRELSPLGSTLTQHLNHLLQSAARKFATWQERKMRQHR